MTRLCRYGILTCWLICGFLRAAETPPVDRELLDRAEMLALASAVTTEKYPDADDALIGNALRIDYRADATYTQWQETYVKILTEKGRRDNSTVQSYYTLPYQNPEDCVVALIEIIKPDGSVIALDVAAQSSTTVQSGDMAANIYSPNDKVITVNVPGLAVGDMLHCRMYDNIRQPRAAGIFAASFMLESLSPIIYQTIEVNGVKTLPLKQIAVRNEISQTVWATTAESADGSPSYRWVIKDVPQAFPEPNMPPLYACAQRLLISTAENWEEISAWYARLCAEPLAAVTPEMRAEVAKIIGGETDVRQKVQLIFTWVSQQIRYLGITTETTSPGYEPHPVRDTFNARHGVCRDKAALLAAMLQIAGIEAYPVLIHTREKKDPQVADPFFNHAIAAAKIGGEYILMDSTDETTREMLPDYLSDKTYLIAANPGEKLHVSPVAPAEKNLLTIETSGSLSAHGDLKAETVFRFGGINDNVYRGYFSQISPPERRRYFDGVVKSLYGDAQMTAWTLTPENPRDIREPLQVKLQFEARDITARGKNIAALPLPFFGARVGALNFMIGQLGLEKRRFPFVMFSTSGISETLKLDLPEEFDRDLSMPVYKPIETPTVDWRRSLARVGKSLRGKNEFVIKTVEFSPEQYAQFKEHLKTIEYNSRKLPVFAQQAGNRAETDAERDKYADSVILRDDTEFEYLDAHSWRERRLVRRKILTYAGLKTESEIKISYNPAVEKVTLERATVISPTGKMQNISAHEINMMDKEWNASAPRYPGGKILVASLPGVEIGSTIEYRVLREVSRQPFFYANRSFREFSPIASRSVTLRAPQKTAVNTFTTLDVKEESALDGARQWSLDDAPQIRVEEFLPPLGSFVPMWFASEGGWQKFATATRELILNAAADQPLAKQKASLLTSGELTLAKVRALVNEIATTVRAAGPDFAELPLALTITPADKTLRDCYGNSADLAALYYAVLTEFSPDLFLVTRYRGGENLPLPQLKLATPEVFTQVLLRVKIADRVVWLNDIDQYAELGTTYSDGFIALNLQTGDFETIRNDQNFQTQEEINYAITLKADGEAIIRKTQILSGANYGAYKKMFAEMRPEERRRYQQTELANLSQAAIADGDYLTDFSAYPGKIEFVARVPKYAVADDGFLYLTLPRTLGDLFSLRSAKRTQPLFLATRRRVKINTLITLPETMRPLVFPNKLAWRSPVANVGKVEIETFYGGAGTSEGNLLRIAQTADISPAYYASALYPELINIHAALTHGNMRMVLFAAKEWLEMQKLTAGE